MKSHEQLSYLWEMIEKIKNFWTSLPPFTKNRYFLVAFTFFVYMLFFDQNDVFTQIELKSELSELEENKAYYQERITETKKDLNDLLTDNTHLEKFAREKYLMKRPEEEIFVLVEKE